MTRVSKHFHTVAVLAPALGLLCSTAMAPCRAAVNGSEAHSAQAATSEVTTSETTGSEVAGSEVAGSEVTDSKKTSQAASTAIAAAPEITQAEQPAVDPGNTARASLGMAEQFVCHKEEMTRRIEIHYLLANSQLPCEVNYYKDSGVLEEMEVLWRAEATEGFCEQNVDALLERLAGWGWQCDL